MRNSVIYRWVRRAVWMAVVGLLVFVAINGLVYMRGRSYMRSVSDASPAQVVVVLGALVFPDGGVSDMVADRLETAYDLYKEGKASKILITGDHGQMSYDEVNTMRRYLEERKGVPADDIFLDHAGFDTYNSMYRARSIFQIESAIIVTQRFHLPRAVFIARWLGLDAEGVSADRQAYRGAEYYEIREMAARLKAFGEVLIQRKPVFLGPVISISGSGRVTHDQPR